MPNCSHTAQWATERKSVPLCISKHMSIMLGRSKKEKSNSSSRTLHSDYQTCKDAAPSSPLGRLHIRVIQSIWAAQTQPSGGACKHRTSCLVGAMGRSPCIRAICCNMWGKENTQGVLWSQRYSHMGFLHRTKLALGEEVAWFFIVSQHTCWCLHCCVRVGHAFI